MVGIIELRGHENFLTRHGAVRDGASNLGLVAVHLCGVDVAVAKLECIEDPVISLLTDELVRSKAELGNGMPGNQGQMLNAGGHDEYSTNFYDLKDMIGSSSVEITFHFFTKRRRNF